MALLLILVFMNKYLRGTVPVSQNKSSTDDSGKIFLKSGMRILSEYVKNVLSNYKDTSTKSTNFLMSSFSSSVQGSNTDPVNSL